VQISLFLITMRNFIIFILANKIGRELSFTDISRMPRDFTKYYSSRHLSKDREGTKAGADPCSRQIYGGIS